MNINPAEVDRKERLVRLFLQSDDEQYLMFIKDELEPDFRSGLASIDNTKRKKEFEKNAGDGPTASNLYLEDGLYGSLANEPPLNELDFEMFSFNIMERLADDKALVETVKAIRRIPRTWKRKRLRIQLFESLRSVVSPYFSMQLYRDIKQEMVDTLDKVESMIEDKGYEVQAKTFDSFLFTAPLNDAMRVQNEINMGLDHSRLTRKTYSKGISLYHIFRYTEGGPEGETHERLQTRTKYHDVLSSVVDVLYEDKDWDKAFKLLSRAKRNPKYNSGTIKKYAAKLNRIRQADDFKGG